MLPALVRKLGIPVPRLLVLLLLVLPVRCNELIGPLRGSLTCSGYYNTHTWDKRPISLDGQIIYPKIGLILSLLKFVVKTSITGFFTRPENVSIKFELLSDPAVLVI